LKNKRVRTIFTPEQLERLEAEFERQQYMVRRISYLENLLIVSICPQGWTGTTLSRPHITVNRSPSQSLVSESVSFSQVFSFPISSLVIPKTQENKMAKTSSRNHPTALGNRPSTTNPRSNGINVTEHVRRIGAVRWTRRK
jgi:hypothetical protein